MPKEQSGLTPQQFATLGELIKYLRERAHLSQRELAAQVGYHHTYISYIEKNQRIPDKASILGRFVPVFGLEEEPEWVQRLLELEDEAGRKSILPASPSSTQLRTSSRKKESNQSTSLTHIFGREEELHAIGEKLLESDTRLLTVIGPPGVGKTRLVQYCAEQYSAIFPDGVVFINLTPITQTELVLPAIASSVGLEKFSSNALITALQNRKTLIILDNFEQVVDAAVDLIPVLEKTANVKFLITSREALQVRGELLFPLAPLPVKSNSEVNPPAIELFIERASAVQPNFKPLKKDASLIAEICSRLDGLPLAIELAAASINTLSLPAMLEQIDDRFEWLTNGPRDLPEWKRTLWGAIEWGYVLLSDKEQTLLNRLSVFNGGWTLETAKAICSDKTICKPGQIISLLRKLVDKSMITVKPELGRFDILESIREFSRTKLHQSGEEEHFFEAHYKYFLQSAQEENPHIQFGSDLILWLDRIAPELNNFRAALSWSLTQKDRPGLAMDLGHALHTFWGSKSYIAEGKKAIEQIIALDNSPTIMRSNLLRYLGNFEGYQGSYNKAREYEEQALEISRSLGFTDGMYLSMEGIAIIEGMQGNYAKTAELLEEVLEYRRQSATIPQIHSTLNNLAIALKRLGNFERARELFVEKIELSKTTNDQTSLGHALSGMSEVHKELKEYDLALKFQKESIYIRDKIGDRRTLINSFENLAYILYYLRAFELSALFRSFSMKLRDEIGYVIPPAGRATYEELVSKLVMEIGKDAFDTAWARGSGLSLDEAVKLALLTDAPKA